MRIGSSRLSATVRAATLLVAAAVVAAACGGATSPTLPPSASPAGSPDPNACAAASTPPDNQEGWTTAPSAPSVFPVIVNSSGSLTCGTNRLLITVLDIENRPVANPDRTLSVTLYNLGRDGATPTQTVDGTFVWGIENERGFYVAPVTFPEAGRWGAEFETALNDAASERIRVTFDVATSSPVVRVGERAPTSDTPTAASVGGDLARISTDVDPEPGFYEVSVEDALEAHEPFVLIFATPKFCTSAQCGPTLDRVKPIAEAYPDVRFINVEPYELTFRDGSLQPVRDTGGALIPTDVVFQWGLLSEPWVFVVDSEGVITASFEGIVGAQELEAAVEAVR